MSIMVEACCLWLVGYGIECSLVVHFAASVENTVDTHQVTNLLNRDQI